MDETVTEDKVILFSPQVEIFTPFANSVDSSRLNMTAKQITQAVISKNTDSPIIIDKDYQKMTTLNSPFAEFAEGDGHILLTSGETMVIYYPGSKKLITKSVPPSKKMINNSLSLKYKAGVGPIKDRQLLFDYTNMNPESLMPKIGYRTKILFSSFFGYTADDAIVISEGFAKRSQIEYSQKIFIPITKEWKYLRNPLDNFFYGVGQQLINEDYLRYFLIDAGDHFMAEIHNINEQPSLFFTKNIDGILGGSVTSVKVHRNTEKSFQELKDEYMYTPGLIDEIEEMYHANYNIYLDAKHVFLQLGIPEEEAIKLAEELFHDHYSVPKFTKNFETKMKEEFRLEPDNVDFMLEVNINFLTSTTRGDKFTNLFAGKGTVSMIVPDEIMPKDPETQEPVDMVFNPLGIFGRNNWGMIFELGIAKIVEDIEVISAGIDIQSDSPNKNKIQDLIQRIEFINDRFINLIDKEYSAAIEDMLVDMSTSVSKKDFSGILKFIKDIQEEGFYLYISNFPGVTYNDFYTNFLEPYGEAFNVNFGKSKVHMSKDLINWLRVKWNYKNNVFGDQSYSVDMEAFIGTNYLLKLYHTSYSKYTAVSLASSYSKITGQPARGRKKTGGQHISWQSLAALLGHKENNGMLKELYSIKGDSPLLDKEKFLSRYIVDGEYNLKYRYVSLTKRAINTALKVLGMKFHEPRMVEE